MGLPDRRNSCGLDFLITGDEGQTEVERSGCDDPVWHVGNNIAGNSVNGFSHILIDWSNEQAGRGDLSGRLPGVELLQGVCDRAR